MRFLYCIMKNTIRKEILTKRKAIPAETIEQKSKEIIDKVLMERLTLTELDNLDLDGDEGPKKVLKP